MSKERDETATRSELDSVDYAEINKERQRAQAYQIWSYSDTGHELTVEEQLFCRSYIIDRNSVAAMRRLGYSDEMSNASLKYRAERMLSNPEVQGCIEVLAKRIMENLQIEAENVSRHMAAIAFADMGEVMEFDHTGVRVIHSKYWTPAQKAALKSVKMGKDGIQVEFHNRMQALEFLAKQTGQSESESDIARAAAEGAASAAIDKIMDITSKMKQVPGRKNSEEDGETLQ